MTKGLGRHAEQPFSARLREERLRIEPSQQDFAEKVGISKVRQCQLEGASREMRADYLVAIAELGLDVMYILLGRRSAPPLCDREAMLLDYFRRLDHAGQAKLLGVAKRSAARRPVPLPDPAEHKEVPGASKQHR